MRVFKGLVLLMVMLATPLSQAGQLERRAQQLAQKYPLVDGHIDVPYRLNGEGWRDVGLSAPDRDFDYPRAKQGGLDIVFMSIYTPSSSEASGEARVLADVLIDQVEALAARHPDKFAMAYSSSEARRNFAEGLISFALGMENGAPVAGKLENLEHFYQRGVRYITLAHALSNHISDSSYDKVALWQGLSPFGFDVVKRMNELGIMVDVSHLSDRAIKDVLSTSKAPVIASHSSLRHFTPDWERNLSDELVEAIAEGGGVVMINFGSTFLTARANSEREAFVAAAEGVEQRLAGVTGEEFDTLYRSKHPFPFASVADVADHIDRVVKLVGIEHVGIGSDYDGVGDSLPEGLKDVSTYPNLVAELLRRDYSERDIELVLGGNALRVWEQVEDLAR